MAMGEHQAAALVARMLRGFPHLSLPDPKGYMAALIEVLTPYPLWCGEFAIKRPGDNPEFPPSDRTLRKWLEEIVSPARANAQWSKRAAEQLDERKALPPLPRHKQTFGEMKAEMTQRGLYQDKKGSEPLDPETVRKKLGVSQADWDAIPNQPVDSQYWVGIRNTPIPQICRR
jgi:hypothetical protein